MPLLLQLLKWPSPFLFTDLNAVTWNRVEEHLTKLLKASANK